MSAIGMPAPRGKGFAISAYADIRHEHLVFERQQSLAMRNMEWENRVQPMVSWGTLLMRWTGVAVLASVVLALVV